MLNNMDIRQLCPDCAKRNTTTIGELSSLVGKNESDKNIAIFLYSCRFNHKWEKRLENKV